MFKAKTVALFLISFFAVGTLYASDVTQWRGNDRTGVYPETGLLKNWPEGGPKALWRVDGIGAGYGSAILVKGKIYVTGNGTGEKKKREFVTALTADGKKLWSTEYGDAWNGSYPEARTTPTYVNGDLFVVSGGGDVACIHAETGELKWSRPVRTEYKGTTGNWGTAESPLVDNGKVFYTVGGDKTTLVALDIKNGKTVWKSESLKERVGYVSPVLITHNGKKQIVGGTAKFVFGADPETGTILWRVNYYDIKAPGGKTGEIGCNTPLYKDGKIFISSGYDHCAVVFELAPDGLSVKTLWVSAVLDTHHHGDVILGDAVYGSTWINNNKGKWAALNFKDGSTLYEEEWPKSSKGVIIAADSMLYCYDEQRGNIALVRPNPKKFDIVSQFTLKGGSGRHWCHPIIADGKLFIRRGEMIACFDLKGK